MEWEAKILLVDDEIQVINALKRVLHKKEYAILTAITSQEAIDILHNNKPDMIICDYNMPDMLGTDILKYAKEILPDAIRILITGYSDIDVAISAINEGSIYYYFRKPWKNQEITEVVEESLACHRKEKEKRALFDILGYGREQLIQIANKLKSNLSFTEPEQRDKVPIREDDDILLINMAEILYLTAAGGDIFVVTQKGKYKSSDSLSIWEQRLDGGNFFRCHRSYIVNMKKVEKISPWFNGTYNLKLTNLKENIPVSRASAKNLKEWFRL